MEMKRVLPLLLALALALGLSACGQAPAPEKTTLSETTTETATEPIAPGNIYLYGEKHGVEAILEKELELWVDYYHNQGLRHLFIEKAYYSAQYLNQWMQADSDEILDALFKDLQGTAGGVPQVKAFYRQIKAQCPETVFHGTDVGHQFSTTGTRFRNELKENGQQDSEAYTLAQACVDQGTYYYSKQDEDYRENMMVENFIREFDSLKGESVMGIYGAAHTGLEAMAAYGGVACMANQLYQHYGDIVQSWDLSSTPLRMDTLTVGGKAYQAPYYGEDYIGSWSEVYASCAFWRLEDAFDDFMDMLWTGNVLPYDHYPIPVEEGQVFVIDYTRKDGAIERKYFRSNGQIWDNLLCTEEFLLP